jgi:hypothetical protein
MSNHSSQVRAAKPEYQPFFSFCRGVLTLALVSLIFSGCGEGTNDRSAIQNESSEPDQATEVEMPATQEAQSKPAPSSSENKVVEPDAIVKSLETRGQQQRDALAAASVYHDFQFADGLEASGITFEHRVVEDAGKFYKPVHYDHGNGVAVADIDGDDLLDLYFTTQIGGNELWRNLGQGKFENVTATAGVALEDRISVAAAFADIDNDGDPDLFVTTVKMGNVMYENNGKGQFTDITETAGLGYLGHSSGSVIFDFNRDGLLDLFLTNVGVYTTDKKGEGGYYVGFQDGFSGHIYPERTEASLLYQNQGNNKFKEVSSEMNLEHDGWSGDASSCDVNDDGWPDLYVLSMQGDDVLYINQEGESFVDKTAEYFPKTPWGAMGVEFFDFNLDGVMDLYVTDMHSDMNKAQTVFSKTDTSSDFEAKKSEAWCAIEYTDEYLQGAANNIFGNAFYVSSGDGKFNEVSDQIGAETFWPWGLTAADLNADGYEDVFVTGGMGFGYRYGINSVLLNDAGKQFVSAEFPLGVEPRAENMKTAFVLDCSGADQSHPYCRGRTGEIPFAEARSTRSSVIFDVENDGDLDLVTIDMNDRPLFLTSNLSDKKSIQYLQLRLIGKDSNRDGLGAKITLKTGTQNYTRYHDGKSGYLAQSSAPIYFGLGSGAAVDQIEIVWPTGKTQVVSDGIELNRIVTVVEE